MSILIAYNLKKYRKLNKLTQQQLSDKIRIVSKPAIALYEKNRRTPDYNIQEKLCEALNISMSVLNGQNEIDYYSNEVKNYLIKNNITSNEFQYIYRQFILLFNNKFFRLTGNLETKIIKDFKQFFEDSFNDIKTNLSNEFTNNEKKNVLLCCFEYILNSFICFNLLVRKDKTFNIYDLNTQNYINYKNNEIDNEFIKVFIELTPTYIKILETLKEIDIFLNSSIPMYFKNSKNIFDYILPNKNSRNNDEILTAIKVNDDFMIPRFDISDIVIAKQCDDYKTGEYVAISDKQKNILLGKLKIENDVFILQPLNIVYSPIILKAKDCKIIGKIIETKYAN